jgi:hypothetical protein
MNVRVRVRPAFAVVVLAALAACGGGGGGGAVPGGGGGGGGGPTPTPVPTATPSSSYVAPTGGVTQLGPAASNQFSSSLLTPSTDGTFVVQSSDTPTAPPASATTLTEYDVTAAESAAGLKPGSQGRAFAALATRAEGAAFGSFRPRRDSRQDSLRELAQRSTSAMARTGRAPQSVRRTSSFSLNAVHTFHVVQGTITGSGGTCTSPQIQVGTSCYLNVTATLLFVSSHGYVWVDQGIDSSYGMGAGDWQAVGSAFDTDYAREVVAFGPAFFNQMFQYTQCDASGNPITPQSSYAPTVDYSGSDPHISILVTKALESSGEGGYFFGNDMVVDQELNCPSHGNQHIPSNALPMFVMAADKYQLSGGLTADESYWRTQDMPRTLPHEFQHLLHYVNKGLIPNLVNNAAGVSDDSFVDEGDSMLAEDLVNSGNAQTQDTLLAAFEYLYNPANYSLTAFTGYAPDPLDTTSNPAYGFFRSTGGNYGAAYLLARYMYDRFGGDTALHRVYSTLTKTAGNGANVDPIVAEANNGETFAQLYADFAAALAARKVASADPRFSFAVTVTLVGTKQVAIPGNQTWDVQLNGPRSPDDLTNTHPGNLPRFKLTPSGTASAKLITGATLFFNAAPSGGSIVSLNSTTAPAGAVTGALVQGGYNDNGSCLGPPSSGC